MSPTVPGGPLGPGSPINPLSPFMPFMWLPGAPGGPGSPVFRKSLSVLHVGSLAGSFDDSLEESANPVPDHYPEQFPL